jgi:hypothetical protein
MIFPLALSGNRILFHPATHRVRLHGFKSAKSNLARHAFIRMNCIKVYEESAHSEVREIPAIRFSGAGVELIFCLMNKPSKSGQLRLKL